MVLTGDVFEDNAVDRLLVRKVGEILRAFPGSVYIIPGNHDPLSPGSVWEHSVWQETTNITVFRKPEPLELEGCIIFRVRCMRNTRRRIQPGGSTPKNVTKPAIGLAHGNVEGIPNGEPDYPIPRDARHPSGSRLSGIGTLALIRPL